MRRLICRTNGRECLVDASTQNLISKPVNFMCVKRHPKVSFTSEGVSVFNGTVYSFYPYSRWKEFTGTERL